MSLKAKLFINFPIFLGHNLTHPQLVAFLSYSPCNCLYRWHNSGTLRKVVVKGRTRELWSLEIPLSNHNITEFKWRQIYPWLWSILIASIISILLMGEGGKCDGKGYSAPNPHVICVPYSLPGLYFLLFRCTTLWNKKIFKIMLAGPSFLRYKWCIKLAY